MVFLWFSIIMRMKIWNFKFWNDNNLKIGLTCQIISSRNSKDFSKFILCLDIIIWPNHYEITHREVQKCHFFRFLINISSFFLNFYIKIVTTKGH